MRARVIDRDKARRYFRQALPQIIKVVVDDAARQRFGPERQRELEEIARKAFEVRNGVIVGAKLVDVMKAVADIYKMHTIILDSTVPLQFSPDLLTASSLSGVASCNATRDYEWAGNEVCTF